MPGARVQYLIAVMQSVYKNNSNYIIKAQLGESLAMAIIHSY